MAESQSARQQGPMHRPSAKPSLRERFDALRNLPPFLRMIWATSRSLTLSTLGLRLIRALVPIATLYIGKLIIDEAVRLIAIGTSFDSLPAAWQTGQLDHLAWLLGMEFALAIGSDLLGRLTTYEIGRASCRESEYA